MAAPRARTHDGYYEYAPGRWAHDLVYRPPPPVSPQLPFQQQCAEWRRAYYDEHERANVLQTQLISLAHIHRDEHRAQGTPLEDRMTNEAALAYVASVIDATRPNARV